MPQSAFAQPAPQPMPQPAFVQPAPQPAPQPGPKPAAPSPSELAAVQALAAAAEHSPNRGKQPTVFPETAAKVPLGPNGIPRLEAEVGVHSDTNFFTNFLGDIHDHGGIFVATYGTVGMGSPCEVAIAFPGELTAEVQGVVRWRREASEDSGSSPGLGIEITQAAPEAWGLIDRFIAKRHPIIYDV